MDRSEFLKVLGTGALMACGGCSLLSCGSNDPEPKVDFTVDLKTTAELTNVGGSFSKNGIIIVQVTPDEFVAFNQACPHAGTRVQYQKADTNFLCPNHLSEFDINGAVTKGPAITGLRRYNTELAITATTKTLRVFS